MSQPVRKPKNQSLKAGRRVHSAIRNTKISTKNPGSTASKRAPKADRSRTH